MTPTGQPEPLPVWRAPGKKIRQVVVGDSRRRARKPLRKAQEEAGVPAGRWMGRGLPVLGLVPGEEVTEAQVRSLFGECRHPHADRIEADQ
ncbi:relaxase domain-containing protein [Streptomyces caniferus]|uniref:hypothetical protein n=1 Tax=Streptomyces caniferus TaxID=285557 RepID=UPI002E27EB33|nr:hypothetical protein [Streptomyces caniferus]